MSELEIKDQVHAKFGQPTKAITKNGETFEEYHTRRKIRDRMGATCYAMGFGMTLGLSEFIAFPFELCVVSRDMLIGQRLQFTYDADGFVKDTRINGEEHWDVTKGGVLADFPVANIRYRDRNPLDTVSDDRPGPFIRSYPPAAAPVNPEAQSLILTGGVRP